MADRNATTSFCKAGLLNSGDATGKNDGGNMGSRDNDVNNSINRDTTIASSTSTSSTASSTTNATTPPAESNWKPPLDTRVFDVYINDGSQQQRKLPDIFDYKPVMTGASTVQGRGPLPGAHVLINTGQGRKVSLPVPTANKVLKPSISSNSAPSSATSSISSGSSCNRTHSMSLALEQRLSQKHVAPLNIIDQRQLPTPATSTGTGTGTSISNSNGSGNGITASVGSSTATTNMTMNSGTVIPPENLTNNDKWPPHIEAAFIDALQLVMKNGTAKIKLKEKNYGRNELISLYIKSKTGEQRSKKQISSHIQVWKKSIANKMFNDIQTSKFESELLNLIENGAEQTPENWHLFETTFNAMIEQEENYNSASSVGDNAGANISMTSSSSSSGGTAPPHAPNGYHTYHHSHPHLQQQQQQQQQYPTSASSMHHLPYHVYVQPASSGVPILPYHIPMMKEPATPIEFAQELYGSLKSFKCVPVNPYEHYNPYTYSTQPQQQPQGVMRTPLSASTSTSASATTSAPTSGPHRIPILSTPPPHPLPGNSSSAQSLYQVAKEVENQQKKLIDEMYNKQNQANHQANHQGNHQVTQPPPRTSSSSSSSSSSSVHHQFANLNVNYRHQQFNDQSRRHPILPPASQLRSTDQNMNSLSTLNSAV